MFHVGWNGLDLSPALNNLRIRSTSDFSSPPENVDGCLNVPSAERFGPAGEVRERDKTALRVARMDVPRYNGGDVAAWSCQRESTLEYSRNVPTMILDSNSNAMVSSHLSPFLSNMTSIVCAKVSAAGLMTILLLTSGVLRKSCISTTKHPSTNDTGGRISYRKGIRLAGMT